MKGVRVAKWFFLFPPLVCPTTYCPLGWEPAVYVCPYLFLAVTFDLFLEGQQTETKSNPVITSISSYQCFVPGAGQAAQPHTAHFNHSPGSTAAFARALGPTPRLPPVLVLHQPFIIQAHINALDLFCSEELRGFFSFHPVVLCSGTAAGVGVNRAESSWSIIHYQH